MTITEPGVILRLARESAGLSLEAMARRTYFSKGHLANIETGKRTATPTVIRAYQDALGDDVNRRQLLMTLLAGAAMPSSTVEALGRTYEFALDAPALTVDDWVARLEDYGRDFMSMSADEIQARLATDLARLQPRLDEPTLAAVAAKLLTLQGLTMQGTSMPSPDGRRTDAVRWYLLAVRAADRSGDTDVQAWVRGRAALALAYEGAELPAATGFAVQALALSERPSSARIHALLALAHAQGLDGDRDRALVTLDAARRSFDVVGSEQRISDFAIPEWRMAMITSLLVSRLGEERLAHEAQETADQALPPVLSRFCTHIELHRAVMMAKLGSREGALAHARYALAQLPPERHDLSLRLRMNEIERA